MFGGSGSKAPVNRPVKTTEKLRDIRAVYLVPTLVRTLVPTLLLVRTAECQWPPRYEGGTGNPRGARNCASLESSPLVCALERRDLLFASFLLPSSRGKPKELRDQRRRLGDHIVALMTREDVAETGERHELGVLALAEEMARLLRVDHRVERTTCSVGGAVNESGMQCDPSTLLKSWKLVFARRNHLRRVARTSCRSR